MQQFIGCDAHKRYSVFVAVNEQGQAGQAMRIAHDRGLYREFLGQLPQGSVIALEATGHYGWLVDEMERMGHRPRLANPLEAKRRMGKTNKADKLDATGLAVLLRNGTLPEVWIPAGELRDQRELLRMRIFLVPSHNNTLSRKLPVNGRTPLMLDTLAMGAISVFEPGPVRPFDQSAATQVSVGGGPVGAKETMLDGAPNAGFG